MRAGRDCVHLCTERGCLLKFNPPIPPFSGLTKNRRFWGNTAVKGVIYLRKSLLGTLKIMAGMGGGERGGNGMFTKFTESRDGLGLYYSNSLIQPIAQKVLEPGLI